VNQSMPQKVTAVRVDGLEIAYKLAMPGNSVRLAPTMHLEHHVSPAAGAIGPSYRSAELALPTVDDYALVFHLDDPEAARAMAELFTEVADKLSETRTGYTV
jgi:hypothetical protein